MEINFVGKRFLSSSATYFTIISKEKDKRNKTVYIIQFDDSGFVKTAYMHNISKGKVKDPYAKILCNVGCIGDTDYKNNEKEYHLWRGIIRRCYDPRRKDFYRYGGKGITVSERWHCFENFIKDLKSVEGYDEILFRQGALQLDKDIKGSKIYSLENCKFVTPKENMQAKNYLRAKGDE